MRTGGVCAVVFSVLFSVLLSSNCFADDPDFSPVKLSPIRATYTKISIKWQPGSSATQAVSYKVFRNNTEVATSTVAEYTDENLQSGTEYIYKVIAVSSGGENSPASAELKVRTIKSVAFENSDKVEQVVDQLHDTSKATTAISLITAVRSGFEALFNTNITFSTIDSDILNEFVNEELAVIQEVTPELSDSERATAQVELDTILRDSFGGNTFEHVYIHSKLTELAEKHYQNGHTTAAKALYEYSLKYLSDQETYVYNTLARLARMKLDEITDESTDAEVIAVLHARRDILNRFFDFFENSTSTQAMHARNATAIEYFKYFPRLLTYSNYDSTVFANAQSAAQAAVNITDDEHSQKTFEKIDAWELVNQKLIFKDSAGNPVSGTMTVRNITADSGKKYYFYNSEDTFIDEREFTVNNGEVIVPAYKGHIYETDFSFGVAGGNPIKFTTVGTPVEAGKVVTFDNFGNPVTTDGTEGEAKAVFIVDPPTAPYNLTSTPGIDVFTLSWDWVNTESFTASHFKVFRGPTEIADVTSQAAANIPLDSPDGISTYTVTAYDANGNASPASRSLFVVPGDQIPYADYFAWMQSYFGDQLMYSCDDPDGDGVNNYQEFINGTDPTRIPGPVSYLQQKTYTKLTIQWEAFFAGTEGVTYKIYRGNTEVGTSTTNSFTDSGLTPGLSFEYKVQALKPDGTSTEPGIPVSYKTMSPEVGDYADKLQQIVDQFNPIDASDYTGASLVTAVKSGLESLLGTNITFSVVDNDILNDFVEEELTLIREVSPPMTSAERLTAQTELSDIMNNSFGGNSFEHMYIYSKLTELGEKHWQAGHKDAAKALYECSLGYLKNMESSVFNSLARLGRFELDEINDSSTNAEIIAALNKNRDAYLRFFDFFENSTSEQAQYAYRMPATAYFKYFPLLLKYDDYNQDVFNTALQLAQANYALNDDARQEQQLDRIAAWELMTLEISVVKPDGSPAAGTLVLKNVSDKLYFGDDNLPEEREFRFDGTSAEPISIPVYVGHQYDLSASFDVTGGPAIQYSVKALPHGKGKKTTYDPYSEPLVENLAEGETGGEIVFVTDQPQTPYNLRAAKLPDTFTLTWDWVAPSADYQLQGFKVYRGDELIGTVTQQQMDNIPRILVENACYLYKVAAVDVNGTQTAFSPTIKVLPEFTDEEKAYFDWKSKYFGDTPMLAYEDPDQDSLSNWEEFLLGSNPTVAPTEDPKANLSNIQQGLHVKYYEGKFATLPNFDNLEAYKEEVVSNFSFSTYSNILNSGQSDYIGMVLEGYFDVPESGTYRFYLTSSDGSKLFINGVEIINNDRTHTGVEMRNSIYLNKGTNAIKIEYCDYTSIAVLSLDWSGPEMERTDITPSAWYTDEDDAVFAEVLAWQKDRDLDGIRDVLEKQYGTDFQVADSDGDGINDGDEVFKYHTDPTKTDTDGDGVSDYEEINMSNSDALNPDMYLDTLESVQVIKGADFKACVGSWRKVNNSFTHGQSGRGSVTYEIDLPKAYIYRLRLNAQEYYPVTRLANIQLYVDGSYVGKRLINLCRTENEDVFFYLPWLEAGKHDVKVYWDNYLSCSSLKINELEVQKIEGPDVNTNNIADWIESSMDKTCTVNEITSSKVSPVCLEGKSKFISMMSLSYKLPGHNGNGNGQGNGQNNGNHNGNGNGNGNHNGNGNGNHNGQNQTDFAGTISAPLNGAGNKWYANVELNPAQKVRVKTSFQNGGKSTLRQITWEQTNIIEEDGAEISLRKGDSLLLTAFTDNAQHGQYQIALGEENYTGDIDSPKVVQFDETGTFTIQGTYNGNGNNTASGSITVKVVDYAFHESEPACWVARARSWDIPKPGDDVKIEFDERFDYVEKSTVTLADDERFELTIDENKDRFVVARLGDDGPVIASKRVRGFEILSSNKTYVRQSDEFEDGTKMYEMLVISTPVDPNVELRLHIFVSGVLFDDGTIEKTITASDFDATGQIKVYFLYAPEATTSVCHTLKAYQDNKYIGVRYE